MRPSLTKYAWLSIGAATITIGIKFVAYLATGSIGLLSDALEGIINLAAAIVVLITLRIVEQPPDESHQYGHDKAEYFSSGIEGALCAPVNQAHAALLASTSWFPDSGPIGRRMIWSSILNPISGARSRFVASLPM